MMRTKHIVGPLLVLLGLYLLLSGGSSYGPGQLIGLFWPSLFVIPLGIFFHWLFFGMNESRDVGLLVPGGILITVGIVCQISMLFNNWEYTWPGFILAPAVGLFELYWFGPRHKGLLIPIAILTFMSALFFLLFTIGSLFSVTIFGQPVLAVALIAIGAFMLLAKRRSNHSDQ